MAKYIDADTVVGLRFFDDTCGIEKTTIEVDTIENILDNFTEDGCPEFADVAPVVHGRWNFIGNNMFECTCCRTAYTTQQLNGLRNYDTDPYAPKFCPNCGAYMFDKEKKSGE